MLILVYDGQNKAHFCKNGINDFKKEKLITCAQNMLQTDKCTYNPWLKPLNLFNIRKTIIACAFTVSSLFTVVAWAL